MDPLLQNIAGQLDSNTIAQMSSALGVEDESTQAAIGLALPVLLGALSRNTSTDEGAESLTNALARDHDGTILQDVSGNITRQEVMDDGSAIIGHVLGQQEKGIESSIGRSTGIDPKNVAMLMSMLAPVVLGVMGQQKQEKNMNASDVSSMLQQNRETAKSNAPELSSLLDMDGDGDISDDMVTLGANLLQSFMKK
ncbi:MAG: DUF937 domain-containing protein [Anaerolineales bacterium]